MKQLIFALLLLVAAPSFAQQGAPLTTKHGFRFIHHLQTGGLKPVFEDDIIVHIEVYVGDSLMQASRKFAPDGYKTDLPSEEEFNNSPSMPAIIDAALLMGVGDSATVYMALDSFLRNSLPPTLRGATDVRYEVKLLKVMSGAEKRAQKAALQARFEAIASSASLTAADYRKGKLAGKLEKVEGGLQYLVVDPGKGTPVQEGELISTHYYGCLTNGSMFDNSFQRGEALEFPAGVGQMIPGFDQGVMQLRHGAKAYLFIPPSLAYGEQDNGPIPGNSELIFYIEIQ